MISPIFTDDGEIDWDANTQLIAHELDARGAADWDVMQIGEYILLHTLVAMREALVLSIDDSRERRASVAAVYETQALRLHDIIVSKYGS